MKSTELKRWLGCARSAGEFGCSYPQIVADSRRLGCAEDEKEDDDEHGHEHGKEEGEGGTLFLPVNPSGPQ